MVQRTRPAVDGSYYMVCSQPVIHLVSDFCLVWMSRCPRSIVHWGHSFPGRPVGLVRTRTSPVYVSGEFFCHAPLALRMVSGYVVSYGCRPSRYFAILDQNDMRNVTVGHSRVNIPHGAGNSVIGERSSIGVGVIALE